MGEVWLRSKTFFGFLGVRTWELFLCFVAIVRVRVYYVDFFVFFVLRHWWVSQILTRRQSFFSSLRSSRFLSFFRRRGDRTSERKAGERRNTRLGWAKKLGRSREGVISILPLFRSFPSVRRLTPSPYCLFCHSFAVFPPFASVWKRKGNGCYAG